MAWLVRDGEVLATCEIAASPGHRSKGLLGRDGIEGAMLLRPARSIHTFGMRFAIDAAFVDSDMKVCRIVTMVPNRLGRVVWSARSVLEAEAGAFSKWDLRVGDAIEVRGD